MKIIITRSYSQKKQLRQFEPIDAFCSVTAEFETDKKSLAGNFLEKEYDLSSKELDKFCRAEVEKTLNNLIPKPEVKKVAPRPFTGRYPGSKQGFENRAEIDNVVGVGDPPQSVGVHRE